MSRHDDTIIRFSGLKPGFYDFSFALADEFFEEWNYDEIVGGNVKIDTRMERKEHLLMLNFHLAGQVTLLCDRCLGEITLPIEGDEQLCVRFSDTEESDSEDLAILPEKAVEIDLAQWLYEYVAVRIPLQHVHPDGECDPEMVRFIADDAPQRSNDDIDPRWEALKQLK